MLGIIVVPNQYGHSHGARGSLSWVVRSCRPQKKRKLKAARTSGKSLNDISEFRLYILPPPEMARIAAATHSVAIPVRSLNLPTYHRSVQISRLYCCTRSTGLRTRCLDLLEESSPCNSPVLSQSQRNLVRKDRFEVSFVTLIVETRL